MLVLIITSSTSHLSTTHINLYTYTVANKYNVIVLLQDGYNALIIRYTHNTFNIESLDGWYMYIDLYGIARRSSNVVYTTFDQSYTRTCDNFYVISHHEFYEEKLKIEVNRFIGLLNLVTIISDYL